MSNSRDALELGPPVAVRGRLGTLFQRLFFRDEHHREQTLLDLIDDLGRCRDETELAHDVGGGLHQALEPDRLHLFCHRGERFRLIYSSDQAVEEKIFLPESSDLPRQAALWQEPGATRTLAELPSEDRDWLRSWGAEWVVPLQYPPRSPGGLVGLLLLGRREGGYSAVLRDLLQTLADRTAGCQYRLIERLSGQLLVEQGAGTWLKECPECRRCFDTRTFFCSHDDSILEPTILVDRVVAGRYAIERRLGRGGMGSVYAAIDRELDRRVAVKLLTGGDRVAEGRFDNEARAGRRLRHPNITQQFDAGPLGPRGGAYMVMELVLGRTLRGVLDAEAPVSPPRVASWFDQILSGVEAAHEHGIIHRDLKPDNIMLTVEDGVEVPKILDFGLAKMRDPSTSGQHTLTAVGMVIGTLSYMSPEQLAAEPVDLRTDIFSLAVIVCESLTGKPPFWARNLGQMLRAVASEPFRLDADTSSQARVADILGKALAKSPQDRYPDVASFRRDLVPALGECEPFSAPEAPLSESRDAARA